MTYNEWRDEIKSNLLCVPEAERRRVLDYYAEAYADRREAGFTEREIIEEFGAPYDAAQRILADNPESVTADKRANNEAYGGQRRETKAYSGVNPEMGGQSGQYTAPQYTQPAYTPQAAQKQENKDRTWVFVLLCVLFAVPIFIVVTVMAVVTVWLCVAPFAVLIAGVATIGAGVGTLFSSVEQGLASIGAGLICFGISLILIPLFTKLVKLMWKLFTKFFAWLKRVLGGKEKAQ